MIGTRFSADPKPARAGGPPVLIGATSRRALERIAEYADGWYPIMTPRFDAQLAQLQEHVARRGRSMADIDVTVLAQSENKVALTTLGDKGVNRIVRSLPSVGRDEALRVLDPCAPVVQWARSL